MAKGKKKKYVDLDEVAQEVKPFAPPSMTSVAMLVPKIVTYFDTSMVKQAQVKPDWKLYRIEIRDNVPFIVREMCDRCGKVLVPVRWRKLRRYLDEGLGEIYLETGLCKDCINASVYVDKYLDGVPLGETEAKKQFYKYGMEYERAWRMVIAAAPRIAVTDQEWIKACKFFSGCAFCGGPIQVQGRFFPRRLNGEHTAWNVIPVCEDCLSRHYRGRLDVTKPIQHYRVFSTHTYFQRTKTIRLYLLRQMELHDVYMEPLTQWRHRFFEIKTLEGSS